MAWIAHLDRLVDYTSLRPYLGIVWAPTGIADLDHTGVPAFFCGGFYGGLRRIVVGGP